MKIVLQQIKKWLVFSITFFFLMLVVEFNSLATNSVSFTTKWLPHSSIEDQYTVSSTIISGESLSGYTNHKLADILKVAYFSIDNYSDGKSPGDSGSVELAFIESNAAILINGSPLNEVGLGIHWKNIPVYSIRQIEIIAMPFLDSDYPRSIYSLINIFTKEDICLDSLSCFDNREHSAIYPKDQGVNIKNAVLGATFYFPMDSILSVLSGCEVNSEHCSPKLALDSKKFFIEMAGTYDFRFIKENEEGEPPVFSEEGFDPEKGFYIGTVNSHKVFLRGRAYNNEGGMGEGEFEPDSVKSSEVQGSDSHLNDNAPTNYEVGVKIEKNKNYFVEFIGFQNRQDRKKVQPDAVQGSQDTEVVTTTQGLGLKWSLILDQLTLKGHHSYTDIIEGFEIGRSVTTNSMLKRRNAVGIDYSADPEWAIGGELTYSDYYRSLQGIGADEDDPQLDIYVYHYPAKSKNIILEFSVKNITDKTSSLNSVETDGRMVWTGVMLKF